MHKVLNELMHHIEELEARMVRFDCRLLDGLEKERNVLQLLCTIPGIDITGAAMLLVEIGTDMSAFGSAGLASWVGICPGNNESASKRKSGRTRKGNRYVRRRAPASAPTPPAEPPPSSRPNTHLLPSGADTNANVKLLLTNSCGRATS